MFFKKKQKELDKEYALVHKLSKFICFCINTSLMVYIFGTEHIFVFILANFTYFFGVNTLARGLEVLAHIKKKHDII